MRTIYDILGCYFCDHQDTARIGDFRVCDEHKRYFEDLRERRRLRKMAKIPTSFW